MNGEERGITPLDWECDRDCDEWRGGTWIRSKEQYCFDSKSRNADSSQERKGLMEASMGVSLNNDNCCSLNGDGSPPLFIHSLSLT